ncbi:MAG TPA: hypothetical protein GXX35_00015 [Thermoanaerobacterales bacterium]|nr:hypothetical protein [Thermoanaerobacterales bacterium]
MHRMAFYLDLCDGGLLIIIATPILIPAIILSGFGWLFGGGILYSIGCNYLRIKMA